MAEGLNPGGLTLPGEADAVQPRLLEAQMGRVSVQDLTLPRGNPRQAVLALVRVFLV